MYNFEAKTVLKEERTTQILIDGIKSWLAEENLVPDMPEEMVALFLLSCQNDIEMTKNTIKAYLEIKKRAPKIFDDREMTSELISATKLVYMASLPERTEQNDVIHIFKLANTNPKDYLLCETIKLAFMLLDVTHNKAPSPPDGIIAIIDMKGAGFWHLRHFNLNIAKNAIRFAQEALPIRIKAVYILNADFIFYQVLSLIKFLIKAEIMQLIIPFSDYPQDDFLKKYVPAKYMPKDYGGDLPNLEQLAQESVDWMKTLGPFFAAEEKLRKSPKK